MIALSAWTLVMGHRVAVPLSILVSINPVGRKHRKSEENQIFRHYQSFPKQFPKMNMDLPLNKPYLNEVILRG